MITTKSGNKIFPVGIGTWDIASTINHDKSNSKYKGVEPVKGNELEEIEAIRYSLSKGQNYIDCAELYGGFYTDEVVGRAMSDSRREDLFISDKIWKTSVDDVRATVNKMLEKLGTDYLDLLYVHAPWGDTDWQKAVPQIDTLIDEGVVRYFGVSNFPLDLLKETSTKTRHVIAGFVGFGNPDITVNSVVPVVDVPFIGDLPLPVMPIEAINDISNRVDHQAQGFKKPEGAAPVTATTDVGIPIISDYDVTNVPDASFAEAGDIDPEKEIIKPGMYMVDFESYVKASLYDDTTLSVVGQSFSIEIDSSKPISVFTKDSKVAEKLQVRISEDGSKLIVSAKPGQKLEQKGEKYVFYVYSGN